LDGLVARPFGKLGARLFNGARVVGNVTLPGTQPGGPFARFNPRGVVRSPLRSIYAIVQ